jgi:tetratricopeptide (TPR) repeat protein
VSQAGLPAQGITEAILFVSRPDLRPVFRKALKDVGINSVATPESVDACNVELLKSDRALLIIDWSGNLKETSRILKAAQGNYSADTRAIMLMIPEINEEILAAAAEYNVARVHSGQVSIQTISSHISAIVVGETAVQSLRGQLTKAAAYQAAGDWTYAGQLLEEMRDDYDDDPRVLAEIVNNFIHQEHWTEALEVAKELKTLFPKDIRGLHLYGRCMMKFARYDEAATALRAANIFNPFNAERLVGLGNALLNSGKLNEAETSFNAALDVEAGNPDALKGKSKCRLLEGDVNSALAILRELSSPREVGSVFNDAAIISIRLGRFAEGIQLYRAAIKAVGSDRSVVARLYFNLGIAFHKGGEPENAYESFKVAVQADGGFEGALYNFRICAVRIGKVDEFRRLTASLRQAPNRPETRSTTSGIIEEFDDSFEDEKIA